MTSSEIPTEPCQISASANLPGARLRVIGYWIDDDQPGLPDPALLIDTTWELAEREVVAYYLGAGRQPSAGRGCSPCRICGTPNGFEEFTDGVYQWPEGLAHYVLEHSVRLPEPVIQHVLSCADQADEVRMVDTTWWLDATS